ncbi:hypothetical protein MUK42_07261 [Musa troglodytarum]|uniref:Protein FAM33A n=1 Tax=Musa troglodytarum TaxID=320322 RepID=A0A9E7KZX2_9LILI|nr:hypothetical protein MUK42_07261 [Musa troglodytarum]
MAEQRRGNQQQRHHHHPAVDDVMKVLSRASRDLLLVQRQLDQEFQRSYPDDVNPCKIVARIKKIQEDLVSLKELCRELLAEKQDLIDKTRSVLVGQRHSLQMLLASSGLPSTSESDDIAYTNLNQKLKLFTNFTLLKNLRDHRSSGQSSLTRFATYLHLNRLSTNGQLK